MSKITYNTAKEYIESYGYKLLSDSYKNNRIKLKLLCPEHHEFMMTLDHFKRGVRCPKCSMEIRKNKLKHSYEYVKEYIESYGYKLISDNYINANEKIEIMCPEGHVYKVVFSSFKHGKRCRECSKKKMGLYKKFSYKYIKESIENGGFELLSNEYINSLSKLEIKCSNGHIFYLDFAHFKHRDQRCPICYYNSKSSKSEKNIQNYIKSIYDGEIKPNDRDTIINPSTGGNLELDVYLPELNKDIEFNGAYGHSFPNKIEKDKTKKEQCRKNNIDLLVIEEENWINNKETCLKVIESFIKENN